MLKIVRMLGRLHLEEVMAQKWRVSSCETLNLDSHHCPDTGRRTTRKNTYQAQVSSTNQLVKHGGRAGPDDAALRRGDHPKIRDILKKECTMSDALRMRFCFFFLGKVLRESWKVRLPMQVNQPGIPRSPQGVPSKGNFSVSNDKRQRDV